VLHRIHFLAPEYQVGWAVGENGWLIKTVNGGATWTALYQKFALDSSSDFANLYDIHFVDANTGWLVGEHGLWYTTTGGSTDSSWSAATVYNALGSVQSLTSTNIGLYAIDVVLRGSDKFAMLTGQPGRIWRSTNAAATAFEQVFDFRTWCGSTTTTLTACETAACAAGGGSHAVAWFEAWDLEISRGSSPLAVMVGGFGGQCGTIIASTDDGTTWNKEFHECEAPGASCLAPPYGDDPTMPGLLTDTWRHTTFKTLYGVGIFDGDNSAVACGYNGQHVYRDPTTSSPVRWRDRSNFSNRPIEATTATIFPLYGAVADENTRATGSAVLLGSGGHVRRTTTNVDNWAHDIQGSPFRMTDVHFETASTGWRVGQFFRITKTGDGGLNWSEQLPQPQLGTTGLAAIAFKPGGLDGISVGAPDNRAQPHTDYTSQPKILLTDDGGATSWREPTLVTLLESGITDGRTLRDVKWAAGDDFWAVGEGGTVLQSTNNGNTWIQHDPSAVVSSLAKISFEGVAFLNSQNGVVVGESSEGSAVAAAYEESSGTITWYDIKPSSGTVLQLTDVKMLGNSAYATGEEEISGVRVGAVYRSDYTGGTFGAFVKIPSQPIFAACTVGGDLGRIPILNEIATNASNGDLWVGGECGRVWRMTSSGTWTEFKSQTSGHVIGMSLTSSGHLYVSSMRQDETQHGLVRWTP